MNSILVSLIPTHNSMSDPKVSITARACTTPKDYYAKGAKLQFSAPFYSCFLSSFQYYSKRFSVIIVYLKDCCFVNIIRKYNKESRNILTIHTREAQTEIINILEDKFSFFYICPCTEHLFKSLAALLY